MGRLSHSYDTSEGAAGLSPADDIPRPFRPVGAAESVDVQHSKPLRGCPGFTEHRGIGPGIFHGHEGQIQEFCAPVLPRSRL